MFMCEEVLDNKIYDCLLKCIYVIYKDSLCVFFFFVSIFLEGFFLLNL